MKPRLGRHLANNLWAGSHKHTPTPSKTKVLVRTTLWEKFPKWMTFPWLSSFSNHLSNSKEGKASTQQYHYPTRIKKTNSTLHTRLLIWAIESKSGSLTTIKVIYWTNASKIRTKEETQTFFFFTGLRIFMMHFSLFVKCTPSNTSLYLPLPTFLTTSYSSCSLSKTKKRQTN